MMQLELPFMVDLPPVDKEAIMDYKYETLKESCDRVRKGLWASNGQLKAMVMELSERLWIIEKNMVNHKFQS